MAFFVPLRRPLAGVAIRLLLSAPVIFGSALVLSAAPAAAEDKTAARDHWERGTKFYDLGKYDDAIREFEAAYEAKGDPAFLYNLAQSHRLAGHPSDSLRFYRTYLRYVPKAPNRADIEARIKELEKIAAEHPTTEPSVTAPPPSNVTGAPGGPAVPPPGPVPTTPFPSPPGPAGAIGPTGSAWPPPGSPGSPPVAGGAPEQPGVAPAAPGTPFPAYPPPETPPPDQKSGRRTAGIAIAAIGGGVFVVGGVFGLVARSQSNKVENADRFDPSVESWGKTSETLQWIGYGVGAAAVITGIVIYATAPRPLEVAPPPRVAVAPLVGSGSGGALLRVRF